MSPETAGPPGHSSRVSPVVRPDAADAASGAFALTLPAGGDRPETGTVIGKEPDARGGATTILEQRDRFWVFRRASADSSALPVEAARARPRQRDDGVGSITAASIPGSDGCYGS